MLWRTVLRAALVLVLGAALHALAVPPGAVSPEWLAAVVRAALDVVRLFGW